MLHDLVSIYLVAAVWFHGWVCGVDHDLRPQPSIFIQYAVALLWPLVLWYAFKKWWWRR